MSILNRRLKSVAAGPAITVVRGSPVPWHGNLAPFGARSGRNHERKWFAAHAPARWRALICASDEIRCSKGNGD
jgi:hypothetical protein